MYLRWRRNINRLQGGLKYNRRPFMALLDHVCETDATVLGLARQRARMDPTEAAQSSLFVDFLQDLAGEDALAIILSSHTEPINAGPSISVSETGGL